MRYRKLRGLTDYRHRARMLTNYQGLIRVVLGKKNRYIYGGLYRTVNPRLPDLCLYYSDTRHDSGSSRDKALSLASRIRDRIPQGSRFVLDKGRRKALNFDLIWGVIKP